VLSSAVIYHTYCEYVERGQDYERREEGRKERKKERLLVT
jgi:hypothetical protein